LIIRVQAFASLAILLLDGATSGLGTAVTSVPSASAIVVLVVAVLVALVAGRFAAFRLAGACLLVFTCTVPALAIFAIFIIVRRSAAVTTVPLAAGNIITVVAVFIALELRSATTFFHVLDTSVALNLIRAVQAFAFFAVSVIFGATTVTAIPSTASIVIVIVAVTIAFPLWCATTFLDRFDASVAL